MSSSFSSMFSVENCDFPYFFITGMTNDDFVTEEQTISTFKLMLYHHLKEQGFDGVIFYDPRFSIHFLDLKSRFILENFRVPSDTELSGAYPRNAAAATQSGTEESAQGTGNEASAANNVSGLRRRRGRAVTDAHVQAGTEQTAEVERFLNQPDLFRLRNLLVNQAYERLNDVLVNTGYRCAVVFLDLPSIQIQSSSDIVTSRNKALRAVSSNRTQNRNIIIFVSESDSHTAINTVLTPKSSCDDWVNFANDTLLPHFSAEEDDGHVLRIGTPGSTEVRNMLNMFRVRKGLNLKLQDVDAVSRNLAAYCSKNDKPLHSLYTAIGQWQRKNAGQVFDLSAAATITRSKRYQNATERMHELTGMDNLKNFFKEMAITYGTENGNDDDSPSRLLLRRFSGRIRGHGLNLALLGRPGTGKSTAAAIIADYYRETGLLPGNRFVPVNATQLRNAEDIHAYIRQAIGGVLFIDEAYSLMDNHMYGDEIISTLVADMGTYAGQMAFVIAGYETQTLALFDANEGLSGRIPQENRIILEDYTGEELLNIFLGMAEKNGILDLSEIRKTDNYAPVLNMFNGWVGDSGGGLHWNNAREAENLLKTVEQNSTKRAARINGTSKPVLELRDFPEYMQNFSSGGEKNIQQAFEVLNGMIGLDNVKRTIRGIALSKQLNGGSKEPGNYIFMGPPGTGKTTVADTFGEILQLLGLIKRRTVYTITAQALLRPPKAKKPGAFVNPNENSLNDALAESENGILFIDEAHQLADSDEGKKLLRQLNGVMDDAIFRQKHCIILAGYTTEMQKLIDADSGLQSRFPVKNRIKFLNYNYEQLTEIMQAFARKDGDVLDPEFIVRTRLALSQYLAVPRTNFGNGRFIRNEYLPEARAARDRRLILKYCGAEALNSAMTDEQRAAIPQDERAMLTKYDIPDKPYNFKALAGPVDVEPEKPFDPRELPDKLYDKDDAKAFIEAINQAVNTDIGYSGGKNYLLSGPAGCGKDYVITAVANTLLSHGMIDSAEVHHFSEGDLVAGYVGQTAPQTRAAVTAAQGGTVVLVQPSSMLPNNGNDNSFGPEAIGEFLRCTEEFGSDTSFVIVDSEAGMDAFLKAYPTVSSSFGHTFRFDDLSIEAMKRIFHERTAHYVFDDEIKDIMDDFVGNWTADRGGLKDNFLGWTNGDEIEKLLEKLEDNWAVQSGTIIRDKETNYPCKLITKSMFPVKLRGYFKKTTEENSRILESMNQTIGLQEVKDAISDIEIQLRRLSSANRTPGCYCFVGNPGVGKTTMARKFGNVLRSTGALKQGYVIEKTAGELMQNYRDFDKYIRMARENVLFIDEAHQLATNNLGKEVIKKLLDVTENVEVLKNTCIILAGYPREMQDLFNADPGLASRMDRTINFKDYEPDELFRIMAQFAAKASEEPRFRTDHNFDLNSPANEAFKAEVLRDLAYTVSKKNPNYGNARYVRNFLQDSILAQVRRLDRKYTITDDDGNVISHEPIPDEEYEVFVKEDIEAKYRAPASAMQVNPVNNNSVTDNISLPE